MSAEDNKKKINEGKEQAITVVKDVVAKVNAIRTAKPAIFYGAVVGFLVLYFVVFSGRNPEVISERGANNLKVGATYMLKSPNANGAENAKTEQAHLKKLGIDGFVKQLQN